MEFKYSYALDIVILLKRERLDNCMGRDFCIARYQMRNMKFFGSINKIVYCKYTIITNVMYFSMR